MSDESNINPEPKEMDFVNHNGVTEKLTVVDGIIVDHATTNPAFNKDSGELPTKQEYVEAGCQLGGNANDMAVAYDQWAEKLPDNGGWFSSNWQYVAWSVVILLLVTLLAVGGFKKTPVVPTDCDKCCKDGGCCNAEPKQQFFGVLFGKCRECVCQECKCTSTSKCVADCDCGRKITKQDPAPEVKDGHKFFAKVIKHRLVAHLTKDGFAFVGGNPKPMDELDAWKLVNKLEEKEIVAAATKTSAVGENGSLLDKLGNALQWVADHKEQIMALVKLLLGILMLFAADNAS